VTKGLEYYFRIRIIEYSNIRLKSEINPTFWGCSCSKLRHSLSR